MLVKREGFPDVEPFDERPARAVGKAPSFVAVLLEGTPGRFVVWLGDPLDAGEWRGSETTTEGECLSEVLSSPEKRECLRYDETGGDKGLGVVLEPGDGYRVVLVSGYVESVEGARVNKDHLMGFSGNPVGLVPS